jgi:hypothetical protein
MIKEKQLYGKLFSHNSDDSWFSAEMAQIYVQKIS